MYKYILFFRVHLYYIAKVAASGMRNFIKLCNRDFFVSE